VPGGQVDHPEGDEVRGQPTGGDAVGCSHGWSEEHVKDPDEQHDDGAVHLVPGQRPDDGANGGVDDGEHDRSEDDPEWMANPGPYRESGDGRRTGDAGERQTSEQAGQHEAGRGQSRNDNATVGVAGGSSLEVHGDAGQERRSPPCGGGLNRRTTGGAQ